MLPASLIFKPFSSIFIFDIIFLTWHLNTVLFSTSYSSVYIFNFIHFNLSTFVSSSPLSSWPIYLLPFCFQACFYTHYSTLKWKENIFLFKLHSSPFSWLYSKSYGGPVVSLLLTHFSSFLIDSTHNTRTYFSLTQLGGIQSVTTEHDEICFSFLSVSASFTDDCDLQYFVVPSSFSFHSAWLLLQHFSPSSLIKFPPSCSLTYFLLNSFQNPYY